MRLDCTSALPDGRWKRYCCGRFCSSCSSRRLVVSLWPEGACLYGELRSDKSFTRDISLRDVKGASMDWRLELVAVPVSDVDRAKAFYTEQVGFHADHDHRVSSTIRFVQLTPRGSACSIAIGTGLGNDMKPGSLQGLQLVVTDIHAARAELTERGVRVSEVREFPWGKFVFFSDPDGNGWSVQQIPVRT